jgi:1-acyl-sn-glycerol-3-phosphate acyltransferase
MNLIKNILGRIFATWAMIVFVITMLLIYIPFLITGLWKEPKRTIMFVTLSRIWMKVFFTLSGVRRIFKGKHHFKKGENYIVVCNHNTFMDVPLATPGIPGKGNKTIAKVELSKIPLFGIIYQRGSVLVDRKSEESRKSSFLQMKQVLQWGLHMCIYPEGTRNKTKEPLARFHDGAFRLAIDSGHAVLPAVIFHSKKVLPPGKTFFYWPHKVEMHFLEPISPKGMTVETLREKVFAAMKEHYTREGNVQ